MPEVMQENPSSRGTLDGLDRFPRVLKAVKRWRNEGSERRSQVWTKFLAFRSSGICKCESSESLQGFKCRSRVTGKDTGSSRTPREVAARVIHNFTGVETEAQAIKPRIPG